MDERPPWSDRRRRTLWWLGAAFVVTGVAAVTVPGELGVTATAVAGVCAFLFLVALVVFLTVPGPGTFGTLVRTVPLAGAVLVVAVLLLLSTAEDLRWLWALVSAVAAAWTGWAVWQTRRSV